MVQEHEKDGIFRVSEELVKSLELVELEGDKKASKRPSQRMPAEKEITWLPILEEKRHR